MLFTASLLTACAAPTARNNQFAADHGFKRTEILGAGFTHVVYQSGHDTNTDARWHVYIEGDGKPWIANKFVAADPTIAKPLMLRLMSSDTNPAIYLGRPCYLGMKDTPPCTPLHWTHQRYSKQVVASMVAVLQQLITEHKIRNLSLFGHSGGGTLAMLMANQIPQTRSIVTLAGNLDIRAWSHRHGYSPLTHSLNPAEQPPLPASVRQLHYASRNDNNIPPEIIKPVVKHQLNAEFIILEEPDHHCCWQRYWPAILQKLE